MFIFLSETAVNIGYSCRLLTDEMDEVFTVDGESHDVVLSQLFRAQTVMLKGAKYATGVEIDNSVNTNNDRMGVITYSNGSISLLPISGTKDGITRIFTSEEQGRYALVINGPSLV